MATPIVVLGLLFFYFVLLWYVVARIIKAGPNEVLIISGRKRWVMGKDGQKFMVGFRMLKGGRTFVWPFIERIDRLSLEPMNIGLKLISVQTKDNERINVNGVVTVKIEGDELSIAKASENFLSKTPEELGGFLEKIIEAKLRNIVGMTPSQDVYANRDGIAKLLENSIVGGFDEMGLKLVTVSISEISESSSKDMEDYIRV